MPIEGIARSAFSAGPADRARIKTFILGPTGRRLGGAFRPGARYSIDFEVTRCRISGSMELGHRMKKNSTSKSARK